MKFVLIAAALFISLFTRAETTYTIEWTYEGEERFICIGVTTGADPYIVQPYFSGIEAWYYGTSTVVFARRAEGEDYETVIDTRNIGGENGLPANRSGGYQLLVNRVETHDGKGFRVYNHDIAGGDSFFSLGLIYSGTGVDPANVEEMTPFTLLYDGGLRYIDGNNQPQHFGGTETPDAPGENGLLFPDFTTVDVVIDRLSVGCPQF